MQTLLLLRLYLSVSFTLLLSPLALSLTLTLPSDVAALRSFKSAIAGTSIPPFSCLSSWNFTNSDPCQFTCGITCIQTGNSITRISAINVDPAGYSGQLPSSLSNLTFLSHLNLAGNSFYGKLPSSLSSLPALTTLILSSNSFSGPIPLSFTNFSSIETLDLSRNSLTGTIPNFLGSLYNLKTLDLSYNQLTGKLPHTLPPKLIELAIRGNSLTGYLSKPTFESLKELEVIELASNQLQGKIEAWLLLLPSLQQINLANNSLTALDVQSPPVSANNQIIALDLGFNKIQGTLPVQLANFSSLVALSLRYNELRGKIPWEYCGAKKGVAFRRLFLDGNFLKGKIPIGFFNITDLVGSFGDNCLENCPSASSLCSPEQKSELVCKIKKRGRIGKGIAVNIGVKL